MPPALLQKFNQLCAYDHCRIPLPWFVWHRAPDASSRLHRRIIALDAGPPGGDAGWADKCAAALLHFVRGTRDILLTWRRMHAACRQGYGVGSVRQLGDLFVATFRHNHPAKLYYATRLFRLERRRWNAVFSHGELTLLLGHFENQTHSRRLWTKQGWADFCREQNIPSPRLTALAGPEGIEVLDAAMFAPGQDLFAKPDVDYSSRGAVLLEWDRTARGWYATGAQSAFIRAGELPQFLTELARTTRFVIQPRLRNAPDLADLASRALVNVRVVTLHHPDNRISILMAALRLPPGDQPTSDVLGSTFSVAIDPETGVMHEAECARLQLGSSPRHPFNGAPLRGRKIAAWPAMRAMALRAHARIPFMPTIGWDLVATADGVLILEANAVWHAYLGQQWGRSPLGETAWAEVMLQALTAKH